MVQRDTERKLTARYYHPRPITWICTWICFAWMFQRISNSALDWGWWRTGNAHSQAEAKALQRNVPSWQVSKTPANNFSKAIPSTPTRKLTNTPKQDTMSKFFIGWNSRRSATRKKGPRERRGHRPAPPEQVPFKPLNIWWKVSVARTD